MMKTDAAYSPGLEGIVAGVTTVSYVNSERSSLMYRGYDINDLTRNSTYEEVAYLLLMGSMPNKSQLEQFNQQLIHNRPVPKQVLDALALMPKSSNLMDLLRSAVSMLAHFDPDVDDTSREANLQKAIRLTAKTATLAAATYRISNGKNAIDPDPSLSHAANFLYMVTGNKPDPLSVKAFDTSLVAYAEHGFNASTFSGRVICSTLSDLYSSVVGSIGALKGPLHGGANEEAMKMLIEIGSADKAKDWIHDAIATKKKIMGFGHREYKNGDPRAIIMTELGKSLSEQLGETKWHDIATVLADVMVNEKKIHPNVDFPTAYIYYLLGLPIDLYTPIFALARVAGWTSHVIEQLENNRLIRPKAIYEGPEYQAYVPIEQRS